MSDEAFHEIQLNGKQLVFTFMAATVVAVVIFLCGVMVGRGVQVPPAGDAIAGPPEMAIDPTAPATTTSPTDTPLTAQETLTYAERLEDVGPPVETLKPAVEAASPSPAAEPAPPAPRAPARTAATADTFREPAGNGFVVQVAAVNERTEAEIIARRLSTKGYPTFITRPPSNGPRVFRVRVGKYTDRREADTISARLEKEEQFKPWITR